MERQHGLADVNGIRMHYVREGNGPLVLLVHGFPQHAYCWRNVMPLLASTHTVVAPDMRGYNLSDTPLTGYDKRTMAEDMRALIGALGFDRAALVAGHDRGARVVHRLALDHPEAVERVCMLDLVPTREVLRGFDFTSAKRYWHWFFHLQPDLPELFISQNLEAYLWTFFRYSYIRSALEEAMPEYVKALTRPGTLRCALEDYRCTFGKDLEDDDASAAAGQKLVMPTLLLWGEKGLNADAEKMLEIWRNYADRPQCASVPNCGYYMADEQPAALAEQLMRFMRES